MVLGMRWFGCGPTDASTPPELIPSPPSIPTPTLDADGALVTHLGEPSKAAHVAGVARAAQARARQDVASIAAGLAEIAAAMHRLAGSLEPAAEGQFSANLSDPRTRLLAERLRRACRRPTAGAARARAQRLNASVQTAQDNVAALQNERERLSLLYQIAQDLNTSLDLEDVLGRVIASYRRGARRARLPDAGDDQAGELRFAAARGADGHPLGQGDFGQPQYRARVWERQRPLLTIDAQMDERLRQHESVVIQASAR